MLELHGRKNAATNKQGWTELDTKLTPIPTKRDHHKEKQPAQTTQHAQRKTQITPKPTLENQNKTYINKLQTCN
jgi:hypothetical protein